MNTLNELAAALADDASFSSTITTSLAAKANLAAPNFTGNVTFDSTTLTVDSSNNRVGIGTASPAHDLDVLTSTASTSKSMRLGTTASSGANNATMIISNGGTGDAMLRFDYEGSNTDRARIGVTASGQQLEFYTAGDNERMRIDSSGTLKLNQADSMIMTNADTSRLRLFGGSSNSVNNCLLYTSDAADE